MLEQKELDIITALAREYEVRRVWLFGSCLDADANPGDIDLAAEDVPSGRFFAFYGKLIMALDRVVDLVNLSDNPPIASIIRKSGRIIYG